MNTKQKTDKGDVVQRLSDIEVQEVSMVDKGANRKKWAFVKSAGSVAETQALVDRFHAAKQGDEEALIGILKELLSQLSPEVLAKLGLQLLPPAGETPEGEPAAESETPEGEEMEMQAAAQKAADDLADKVRVLEEQLQKAQDELASAKVSLSKVGEPQSGREPRGGAATEVAKSEGDVRTLGCKPLNK